MKLKSQIKKRNNYIPSCLLSWISLGVLICSNFVLDFPVLGSVVKNLPTNAEDVGSTPG